MGDKGQFTEAWYQNVRRVLAEVEQERVRQHNKFGTQNHSIERWFLVLGEEYGEANTDALEAGLANDPRRLHRCRKELLEVAAVAVVMVESLDRNELKGVPLPDDMVALQPSTFEFESVYKEFYPRKQGKVDGLAQCKKQIKNQLDYDTWVKAVKNYSDYYRTPVGAGTFRPEPLHFDTFMNKGRWREFADPDWVGWALPKSTDPLVVICELDGHTRTGVPLCKYHSYGIAECRFAKDQPALGLQGGRYSEVPGEPVSD